MKTIQAIIEARGGLAALKREAISIENNPYMRLCIEQIDQTPGGWPIISVAHYGEQNGDAMRDPDMVFEVYPFDKDGARYPATVWKWLPMSFQDDYMGTMQHAVYTDGQGRKMMRPKLVKELTAFAAVWDRNIRAQGYAEAAALQGTA